MAKEAVLLDDLGVTPFLRRVTLFSSGGPFLEGYVLGVVGIAMVKMVPDLHLTDSQVGAIGTIALAGLFVGAILGGWATDKLGRRKMFVIDVLAIAALSIGNLFVHDAIQLIAVRFLIGVAIGADYPIATSMIAEFTPRRYRAISMGFIAAVWYVGANVSYLVGYLVLEWRNGWRWALASSLIPCIIILVGRWSIPESPRWLYSKGRKEEADQILHDIFDHWVVLEEEPSERTRFGEIFKGVYLKRILFVGFIWLCQAIPMFAIYTYGPQIMGAFGFDSGRGILIGESIVGTFFLLGTIPAMFLAEWLGRRPLIIYSFLLMTAAMAVLGWYKGAPIAVVIACFGIYAICSGGPGNLQWLYLNELFPTQVRASAMGVAMAFSRIGTVFSIYLLPGLISTRGIEAVMLMGAGISALGALVSILFAPETKGLTLAAASSVERR